MGGLVSHWTKGVGIISGRERNGGTHCDWPERNPNPNPMPNPRYD